MRIRDSSASARGGAPAARPWCCDRGAEQIEYLLVFAAVVLPMIVAARLLWAVLLHYFTLLALVVDLPLF